MSELNNRYWLETEYFFNNNKSHILSEGPYHDSKSQTRFSRFADFPESKMFFNKPTPLYTTQYADLFITYEERFNMHTGKLSPLQLPEDEQCPKLFYRLISSELVRTQNEFFFFQP